MCQWQPWTRKYADTGGRQQLRFVCFLFRNQLGISKPVFLLKKKHYIISLGKFTRGIENSSEFLQAKGGSKKRESWSAVCMSLQLVGQQVVYTGFLCRCSHLRERARSHSSGASRATNSFLHPPCSPEWLSSERALMLYRWTTSSYTAPHLHRCFTVGCCCCRYCPLEEGWQNNCLKLLVFASLSCLLLTWRPCGSKQKTKSLLGNKLAVLNLRKTLNIEQILRERTEVAARTGLFKQEGAQHCGVSQNLCQPADFRPALA